MRLTVTGEWNHNRLLKVVVVRYCFFGILLRAKNWMLCIDAMDLRTASVGEHHLDKEKFRVPRSSRGMLELAHFRLFAMGMSMMVLTHLALFMPIRPTWEIALIVGPFVSALVSEGSGWLVRPGGAGFGWTKIAGLLLLQGSLAALVAIALGSVFAGKQAANYTGPGEDGEDENVWG